MLSSRRQIRQTLPLLLWQATFCIFLKDKKPREIGLRPTALILGSCMKTINLNVKCRQTSYAGNRERISAKGHHVYKTSDVSRNQQLTHTRVASLVPRPPPPEEPGDEGPGDEALLLKSLQNLHTTNTSSL